MNNKVKETTKHNHNLNVEKKLVDTIIITEDTHGINLQDH